jgi:hypothetical protein
MAHLNWRRYQALFDQFTDELLSVNPPSENLILPRLQEICYDDPAVDLMILGVESPLIAFLEYLFSRAEGPYSPRFLLYSSLITMVYRISPPLCCLLNLNAADTIGNMILNKRGRLKFSIADHLELILLLDWWSISGLKQVAEHDILDAILHKVTISHRIASHDPELLIRLVEVFPSYQLNFFPPDITWADLLSSRQITTPLPSHRRYHHLYTRLLDQGKDLQQMIREEERRVLPMQTRRNTFLAFLVRQLHEGQCLLCALIGAPPHQVQDSQITVHHIIPLSEGGTDTARNMLVVCKPHHMAIHGGQIQVSLTDMIEVRIQTRVFRIEPNP